MNFIRRVCELKLWVVLVLYVLALSNFSHLCSARYVRDYSADVLPSLQAVTEYADPRERVQQVVPEYLAQVKSLQTQAQNAVSDRVRSWWTWWKSYSNDSRNATATIEEFEAAASPPEDNSNRGDLSTHDFSSESDPELLPTKFPDPNAKDGCNFKVESPSGLWRNHFFAHDETRIAMARADAAATARRRSPQDNNRGDRFPSFPPSKDRCIWDYVAVQEWDTSNLLIDELEVMAADLCSVNDAVPFFYKHRHYGEWESCRRWHDSIKAPRDVDLFRGSRSFNVFVRVRVLGLEILAEGVYDPVTGQMHLAGCTQDVHIPQRSQGGAAVGVLSGETVPKVAQSRNIRDRKKEHPGLSSNSSSSEVCAVAVTLHYPPVNPRWNSQRVLKFALRSTRAHDDPLHFDTVERTIFFPYYSPRDFSIDSHQLVKTAGWVVLLVLGLTCVAMQIQHGSSNEEALPFVSLSMLGILLIHHLSRMPIFQEFQIGKYRGKLATSFSSAADLNRDLNYYVTSAWVKYVPYQSMTTAALFMYVFIFHKVGDRRRIMQLRVRRGRPSAKDPPSDGPLVFATLTIFCVVVGLLLGFPSSSSNVGMTMTSDAPRSEMSRSTFWEELWGFVNNVTGMMVSLFLVPQVLGNWRWELQGRPLSAWFYVGLPVLRALRLAFCVAKTLQLVPIFAWYDPYLNSYGHFERILVPWWEIGVVLCSALLVLVVHFQFAAAPPLNRRPSWHSTTGTKTPFVKNTFDGR